MALYHRLHLLDYGRAILILAAFSGGWFFLSIKTKLHQKTSRQNLFYQALSRVDQLILTLPRMDELLSQTCRIIVEEGEVLLARFVKLDSASGEGSLLAYYGSATEEFIRRKHSPDPLDPDGSGLWAELVRLKEPLVWNNLPDQTKDPTLREILQKNSIFSGVGVPVFREGSMFGALIVYSDEEDFFDPELINLIKMLVKNISFAIDNRDRESGERSHPPLLVRHPDQSSQPQAFQGQNASSSGASPSDKGMFWCGHSRS